MSKTTTHSQTSSTSPFEGAFAFDPARVLDAQRQAAITGIEGLISMHSELRGAMHKGLDRVRAESEGWAKLSNEIVSESMATSFDLSQKALSTWRDEIARFGKAQA